MFNASEVILSNQSGRDTDGNACRDEGFKIQQNALVKPNWFPNQSTKLGLWHLVKCYQRLYCGKGYLKDERATDFQAVLSRLPKPSWLSGGAKLPV
tara:strand:+ start:5580 stop:5867 length:288 start_codon:yes stop_codon:yes gene_type:complete